MNTGMGPVKSGSHGSCSFAMRCASAVFSERAAGSSMAIASLTT